MLRRPVLATVASLVGVVVAGCFDNFETSDDSVGDGEPTESGSETKTSGDEAEGALDFKTNFVVRSVEFTGTPDGTAAIAFDERSVTVTGTIPGSNSCYTARLDAVTVDEDALHVRIESFEDRNDGDGCYDGIVGIDYELRIESDSPLPAFVTVGHNGEKVATDSRS